MGIELSRTLKDLEAQLQAQLQQQKSDASSNRLPTAVPAAVPIPTPAPTLASVLIPIAPTQKPEPLPLVVKVSLLPTPSPAAATMAIPPRNKKESVENSTENTTRNLFRKRLKVMARTEKENKKIAKTLKSSKSTLPKLELMGQKSKLFEKARAEDAFLVEFNNLNKIVKVTINNKDSKERLCLQMAMMGHLASFFRVCSKANKRFVSPRLASKLRNNLFHVQESALLPRENTIELLCEFARLWIKFYQEFETGKTEILTFENVTARIKSTLIPAWIKDHVMMPMPVCNGEINATIGSIKEIDSLTKLSLFRLRCEARTYLISRGHAITSEMRFRLNRYVHPGLIRQILMQNNFKNEVIAMEIVQEARRLIKEFVPLTTYALEYRHGASELARSLGLNLMLPTLTTGGYSDSSGSAVPAALVGSGGAANRTRTTATNAHYFAPSTHSPVLLSNPLSPGQTAAPAGGASPSIHTPNNAILSNMAPAAGTNCKLSYHR